MAPNFTTVIVLDSLKTKLFIVVLVFLPFLTREEKAQTVEHSITFHEDGIKITITDTRDRIREIDPTARDVYEYDKNVKLKVINDLKYYEIRKRKTSKEAQRI